MRLAGIVPEREKFTLAIRPEKIRLTMKSRPGEHCICARVEQLIYVGSETHYELRAGAQGLRAEIMNTETGAPSVKQGEEVWLELPPHTLIVLDD